MEMIVAYLTGVVVLQGLSALRLQHENVRIVFVICLFWPVSIVLMVLLVLMQLVRWEVDVAESTKKFGFRKPTNPQARGFAVTVFNTEFQFYSVKKVD
jgi:hydrogenase maturation factor